MSQRPTPPARRPPRRAWLDHAHRALDEAVAEAYGWGDDWCRGALDNDPIIALNQARTGA